MGKIILFIIILSLRKNVILSNKVTLIYICNYNTLMKVLDQIFPDLILNFYSKSQLILKYRGTCVNFKNCSYNILLVASYTDIYVGKS